ncbi:MAG TPA: M48 family metallopeptidase [Sandaracinaceae bacterium]
MADIDSLYPPRPEGVPADLTAPTRAYKRNAWLAFGSLVAFVALYLGLTGYFGWLVYRLVRDSFTGGHGFLGALLALPPLFFCLFLLRGLFSVKQTKDPMLVEVTEQDQPELLAFVRRVADETGAPRPHRVFLSPRVNAAVFYDLSFLNLLFPSKKNLEIGLGLVNALSLDELKAVVAHEFGHFAQRTMAVGRWVYVAQQIAGHVIATRSWLDGLLAGVSRVDTASRGSVGSCASWCGRSARSSTPPSAASSSRTGRSGARWSCRRIWSPSP